MPLREPSALKEAHDEILERLRELIKGALVEDVLVPVEIPRNLQLALRECDRMEGIGKEWEQAVDGLVDLRESED